MNMKIKKNALVIVLMSFLFASCSRDLDNSMYTSSNTTNLTMEGVVISTRAVKIKETDKLEDNKMGMLAGGVLGGVAGTGVGGGTGKGLAIVGGAIGGAALGALAQKALSNSKGIEYIVKVDTSNFKDTYFDGNAAMRNVIATAKVNGLLTVVQGQENPIGVGQKVYVIFSENRTRVIAAN